MTQQRIRLWGYLLFLLGISWTVTAASSKSPFGIPSRLVPFQLQPSPTTLQRESIHQLSLLQFRGGYLSDDEEDSDVEEESEDEDEYDEEEDDEELFGLDGDDFEAAESEFAEDNTFERMINDWQKTPPFTKAYLSASFAATAYGYMACGNEFPKILSLEWGAVKKFQVWRLFTAFLNFGPFGLGYVMTAHFVWTYMSTLERLHHDKPYDFWILMLFGQMSMVIGYPILKMSPKFLGHNLSTFLVYIWARFHEGLDVNIFDLFNTRAELLPWFFLLQTFLLEGEPPILDFLGIVFGHVYHHCKTVGILKAPPSLIAWYKGDSTLAKDLRSKYKVISQDFELVP